MTKNGYSAKEAINVIRGGSNLNKDNAAVRNAKKAGEDTSSVEQNMSDTRAKMSIPKDMLSMSKDEVDQPYIQTTIQIWRDSGDDIYPSINFNDLPGKIDESNQDAFTKDYMRNYKRIMNAYVGRKASKADIKTIKDKLNRLKKSLTRKYAGGDTNGEN